MRYMVVAIAVVGGCYSPDIEDGQYLCSDGLCPAGFVCSTCRRCVHAGGPVDDHALCSAAPDLAFAFDDLAGQEADAGEMDLSTVDLAPQLDLVQPRDLSPLPAVKLAVVDGVQYYKVQAAGTMTNANVLATCKAAGMVPPCGAPQCFSDNMCKKVIAPVNCPFFIWDALNLALGGVQKCGNQNHCMELWATFLYAPGWSPMDDSSRGDQSWPQTFGSMFKDGFAICVQ